MGTSAKKRRKYIKKFDTILPFLWLMVYGCYHRNQFKALGISGGVYDDCLRVLHFTMAEDTLAQRRYSGGNVIRLQGDAYHGSYNELEKLFSMKTLSPLSLVCNLLLLSVLSHASGESLTMAEIQEQVDALLMREDTVALSDFLDQHDGQTKLYRSLKDLVAEGLVVSERQADKNVAYRLADNPLLGLTEEEAQALLLAVRFGANTAPITMPGWQLERTLRDLYPEIDADAADCLQFRHSNPPRLLDDVICAVLVDAIREKKLLDFVYRGRKKTGLPIRLQTEYPYNRQYVTCLVPGRSRFGTETFLVNQMMKVKPSSGKTTMPQEMPSISRKGHICLRLHGDAQTREKTSEEIRKQCRSVVFHEDGTCEMHVEDVRRYLPWLRSLSPQVEILPSSSGDLRDRMKNQLKEALAHYGIVR